MAQKDAPGHAEEKHALHHDGSQRSMVVPRNDDENQAVTGYFPPERGGLAASLVRDFLEEEGKTVISIFQGGEATFANTKGTLTRID